MKANAIGALVLAGLLVSSAPAAAQAAASGAARGDVTGIVAWQVTRTTDAGFENDDWHNGLFAGAGGGLYWTPHLKTELDLGAGTRVDDYQHRRLVVDGRDAFQTSRLRYSRRHLGISQQYQFLENAWFHPHVAVGALVTWERRTERFDPLVVTNPVSGRTEVAGQGHTDGPETEVFVRPFVGAGFKAYLSPRAFFRSDIRVAFRDGVDEALARVGFGIDF